MTCTEFRTLNPFQSTTLNQMRFRFVNMKLIKRVQKIIDDQQIEQIDLAVAAGVTKGTVTQWLQGKIKSMKFEYAVRIWRKWGYSPMWLILNEGPVFAPTDAGSSPLPLLAQKGGNDSPRWPFDIQLYARYDSLGKDEKEDVESDVEYSISKFERKKRNSRSRLKRQPSGKGAGPGGSFA